MPGRRAERSPAARGDAAAQHPPEARPQRAYHDVAPPAPVPAGRPVPASVVDAHALLREAVEELARVVERVLSREPWRDAVAEWSAAQRDAHATIGRLADAAARAHQHAPTWCVLVCVCAFVHGVAALVAAAADACLLLLLRRAPSLRWLCTSLPQLAAGVALGWAMRAATGS